jgi:hypothetical protein
MNTLDLLKKLRESTYTTNELLDKLTASGVKGTTAYINVVIMRSKAHPLKAAKIARGVWDKQIVDEYFKQKANHE